MTCGAGLTLLGRGGRELVGSGTACVPDPYYNGPVPHTVLLLHGETMADSSSEPKTVTPIGSAAVSTAQSKFGGSSYLFNGTTDRLSLPAHADFNFGSGAYTIEAWMLSTDVATKNRFLFSEAENITGGFAYMYLGVLVDGTLQAYVQPTTGGGGPVLASSPGLITTGGWHHVALSVAGSNALLFYDGVLVATSASWVAFPDAKVQNVSVGAIGNGFTDGSAGMWSGYIEELRITKGAARYTIDFTTDTVAFCNSGDPPYTIDPPPTTVPPETYVDLLWPSVRFLSAMDLTKVNLKTSVAYTQDSAAVTATDPFDGAGALACVYPPESPTSTPFSPAELATLTLRGASGSCVEMWVRLDAWATWTSGAYKWANLVQQDDLGGDPAWAVGIADELVDGVVTPCLQLFSHYIDRRSYLEIWRRLQRGAAFPVDGQWHHLAVDFRSYSGFVTTIVVYLDGAAIAALTAPDYTVGQTLQFAGQTTFDIVEGTGIYTTPAGLSSTTFDGALDEVRVTEASRYPSNFTVPHYAFPRS